MNLKTILALSTLTILIVPAAAFASTYQYVNTAGSVQSVTADSSAQALAQTNIAATSGVILVSGFPSGNIMGSTGSTGSSYLYVNTNGSLSSVQAASPALAFGSAINIAANSGVIPAGNMPN